ncbi:hypothetical protein PGT21_020737 [Puccinia graminis f. sp. tritici]|uniref:Uncharacterized protein n=1 Tax=Puccinia graminis f. sp. tritici TaxID=56615 RepID=A0A5B0P241_PUCGR|nr:hypothetical protein PGTUg99_032223 [Puccinia graminis f. sp. tritici]KAA1099796.1 hypothetical protein PGT21_020737 [Puccinia graminis f. sp. tritici]
MQLALQDTNQTASDSWISGFLDWRWRGSPPIESGSIWQRIISILILVVTATFTTIHEMLGGGGWVTVSEPVQSWVQNWIRKWGSFDPPPGGARYICINLIIGPLGSSPLLSNRNRSAGLGDAAASIGSLAASV